MWLISVTGTRSIYMYAQDISGKQASSLHGLELRSRDCRSAALPIEVLRKTSFGLLILS